MPLSRVLFLDNGKRKACCIRGATCWLMVVVFGYPLCAVSLSPLVFGFAMWQLGCAMLSRGTAFVLFAFVCECWGVVCVRALQRCVSVEG